MKIGDYLLNSVTYKIDKTYQRPANAWSRKDKQCLIDTIMRGEPVPQFFINRITNKDINYIVDGQQRLQAIKEFHDNKFPLSGLFSEPQLDGKKFEDLSNSEKNKFLNYKLNFWMMYDYDDERVRMIFSRLQRGKPLGIGEKLNAKPGKIVTVMRKLAEHDYIKKSIWVNKQRYHTYEDVARMIYYEKYGAKDCSTDKLNELFDKYKDDITLDSKIYKKIQSVLNYLLKCFPTEPGNYQFLSKHAWVVSVYDAISDLKETYALKGREKDIARFIQSFHNRVYSEDDRRSNTEIQWFYDNARGGWAERLIKNRKNTLKEFMIHELNLKKLDINRQISDEDKIAAFKKANKCCEKCGVLFKDYKEAKYHHIELFSKGGKSTIDNIQVLCKECHDEIHRCNVDTEPYDEEFEE